MSGGDRILLTGVRVRSGATGCCPEERGDGAGLRRRPRARPRRSTSRPRRTGVAATVHYGELAERGRRRDRRRARRPDRDRSRSASRDVALAHDLVDAGGRDGPQAAGADPGAVRRRRGARSSGPRRPVRARRDRARHEPRRARHATLDDAVAALRRLPGLTVGRRLDASTRRSRSRARTRPRPPRYGNRVVVGRTTLAPRGAAHRAARIERVFGRRAARALGRPDARPRSDRPRRPRARPSPGSSLPHPRAHERDFVLRAVARGRAATPCCPAEAACAHLLAALETS